MVPELRRTDSGLLAKHHFYKVPLVWVEGPEDLPFYQRMLAGVRCRIENARGRRECEKLAKQLIADDSPYVVIIDGDYDCLSTRKSAHHRVVLLSRYSIENYFFDVDIVARVCADFGRHPDVASVAKNRFSSFYSSINNDLRCLIIMDIACVKSGSSKRVLPNHPAKFADENNPHSLDRKKIADICRETKTQIDRSAIAHSRALIVRACRSRNLAEIVRGHFLFSLLRLFVLHVIQVASGRRRRVDNDSLRVALSSEVWHSNLNSQQMRDHRALKRRVKNAIGSAQRLLV